MPQTPKSGARVDISGTGTAMRPTLSIGVPTFGPVLRIASAAKYAVNDLVRVGIDREGAEAIRAYHSRRTIVGERDDMNNAALSTGFVSPGVRPKRFRS